MMRLLDLFSGIGGFSLGLERSGAFKTVAFCEIEPYCQKVLAKHWPQVPIYDDVRTITAERLAADGIAVDAICGGFPCQDISFAGKGAGLEGERSGLWFEYARIVGEFRPRYVIVENVSALLSRGLDRVLGTLASLGYDAEWHCIPASAIGAPHRRDRMWIVAHTSSIGWAERNICDPEINGQSFSKRETAVTAKSSEAHTLMADPKSERCKKGCEFRYDQQSEWLASSRKDVSDALCARLERYGNSTIGIEKAFAAFSGSCWWSVEPDVGRVANGVPARTHRLKALGNAVVPQIPELIGRAIAAREAA